jgi:hypothetical protein
MEPLHVAVDAAEYCLFQRYDWWWFCMEKGEWASWAQAIGAIIALLLTLLQMYLSGRSTRKEKAEKLKVINRLVSTLEMRWAKRVYSIFYTLGSDRQTTSMIATDPLEDVLSDTTDLAKTIDISNLPDPATIARVLELSEKITTVLRIYRKYASQLKDPTGQLPAIQKQAFIAEMTVYFGESKRITGWN